MGQGFRPKGSISTGYSLSDGSQKNSPHMHVRSGKIDSEIHEEYRDAGKENGNYHIGLYNGYTTAL